MEANVLDLLPNRMNLVEVLDLNPDREAWLAARRGGIGGSDIGAILGVNPWKTPMEVWREKRGEVVKDRANWQMRQGNAMEATIVDTWAESAGAKTLAVPMLRDVTHPHRLANLDRVALVDGNVLVLETKWSTRGLPEVLPDHYLLQVLWYEAITGLKVGGCAIGGPFEEPVLYPVAYLPDVCDKMLEAADQFWHDCVIGGAMPAAFTVDERMQAAIEQSRKATQVVPATPEAEEIAERLKAAKQSVAEAEGQVDSLKASLAEVLTINGAAKMLGAGWTAAYVDRKGSVDWKALAAQYGIPDAAQDATRGPGSRHMDFRLKKGG